MAVMEDRIWYYYNGQAQVGPMLESELRDLIVGMVVRPTDYIYRDGFDDWRLLSDLPELMGPGDKDDRRNAAPRAPIFELVVAHNDRFIATGTLRNISLTGVFLETEDKSFSIQDEIKLTLKEGRGLGKPLHLRGVVVRKAVDGRYPQGYGLELKEVDKTTRDRISDYIRRHQQTT